MMAARAPWLPLTLLLSLALLARANVDYNAWLRDYVSAIYDNCEVQSNGDLEATASCMYTIPADVKPDTPPGVSHELAELCQNRRQYMGPHAFRSPGVPANNIFLINKLGHDLLTDCKRDEQCFTTRCKVFRDTVTAVALPIFTQFVASQKAANEEAPPPTATPAAAAKPVWNSATYKGTELPTLVQKAIDIHAAFLEACSRNGDLSSNPMRAPSGKLITSGGDQENQSVEVDPEPSTEIGSKKFQSMAGTLADASRQNCMPAGVTDRVKFLNMTTLCFKDVLVLWNRWCDEKQKAIPNCPPKDAQTLAQNVFMEVESSETSELWQKALVSQDDDPEEQNRQKDKSELLAMGTFGKYITNDLCNTSCRCYLRVCRYMKRKFSRMITYSSEALKDASNAANAPK